MLELKSLVLKSYVFSGKKTENLLLIRAKEKCELIHLA